MTSRLMPPSCAASSSSLALPSGFSVALSKSKNASAAKLDFFRGRSAFWLQRSFVEIEECISSEADFFRGRSNYDWHWHDWCWCWSRYDWCWRSHAFAVLQGFWLYAQWYVATWHCVSRCPVAGTPAQAEWVTHDHAAGILHVSAFWAWCFDVSGNWREWWGGWGLGRSRASNHCGCSEKQRYKFIHSFFLSGG